MSPSAGRRGRWPLSGRGTWALVLLVAIFAGLRGVAGLAPEPQDSAVYTEQVVVVGVTGRPLLTDADRTVLAGRLDAAQVGAAAVRTRYLGECAAAAWATLGAGRRTTVAGQCAPQVAGGRVIGWEGYLAAAAANRGDARLGTLATTRAGCTAAVGPGAALAAAQPDGAVPAYATVAAFEAGGLRPDCPLTLVDAGEASDRIVATLADRDDVTLIVTGVGPAAGSADPALQVIYRVGTTLPGLLTSESTRRPGVVTLTDLTRTLVEVGRPEAVPPPVDGSPLQVLPTDLTLAGIDRHLRAVAALSDAVPAAYAGVGLFGGVLAVILVLSLVTGRLALTRLVLLAGSLLAPAMMLAGALPWWRTGAPAAYAVGLVVAWTVLLTTAALLLGRVLGAPALIAGTALTVAAFTLDAALGGPMQPGSLLNSRPIFGLRWYGFGNVTFAAYASAALLLAGYVAHRLLAAGRRRAAVVAAAAIGFGVVGCEGWPTMGSDFGGVIALTPAVLWLTFAVSGMRLTWPRVLAVGGTAVLVVGLISGLDWARGPDRRSHLGNFVQRILDGDALDVVSRKAVAAVESVTSPIGLGALIVGVGLWLVMFRYVEPGLRERYPHLRTVLVAALATAILGMVLNDAGGSVWLTVTATTTFAVAWSWLDCEVRDGWTPPWSTAARR